MEYVISDTCCYPDKDYGVFFYGEKVFLEKSKPEMNLLRSYLFRFAIHPKQIKKNNLDQLNQEYIEFIYTCRLSEYLSEKTFKIPWKDKEEPYTLTILDCEKLAQLAAPEQFKTAIERLIRKVGAKIPMPVSLPSENAEFLEFTPDSADNWGGPFELNGRQGCGVTVQHDTKKRSPKIDIYDYSYWNCSPKIREELNAIAKENDQPNGDYLFAHVWNKKDKKDYFLKLNIAEQITIVKSYLSWHGKEYMEGLRPFKLYLFGNDDCSYSKWFDTAAEMEEELNYLRMMQPLDFNKDIKERNYIFTN